MSKVKVTLFLRDSHPISAVFTEEGLNDLARDVDDYAELGPGAWHAALAAVLDSSREGEEFFLEGVTTAHIRKSGDIVGFTIEPEKEPRLPPSLATLPPLRQNSPSNLVARGHDGNPVTVVPSDLTPQSSRVGMVFFSLVAVLAIAVIVFLQMRGG